MYVVGDHFSDDGQKVSDPDWIQYGLARGWSLLTQDERIATQPAAMGLLRAHRGVIHCLDSAKLVAQIKAERFHSRQKIIYQRAIDRRTGFYIVHEVGAPRRKR